MLKPFTFADISEEIPDDLLPPLDKASPPPHMTDLQRAWREHGYVVLRNFIPDDIRQAYHDRRAKNTRPNGWITMNPYLHVPEAMAICTFPALQAVLKELIGEEMGVHLNLTGWVSTERDWHQDDYLNPPFINAWYTAVWMAIDDIDPRSGPFEYVPGSHKWPVVRQRKLFEFMPQEWQSNPDWPRLTQEPMSAAFEAEIHRRGMERERFIPNKGDILIWHGRLAHRGTQPEVPGMVRKSMIAHYSALSKRPDMPDRRQLPNGSWYFAFNTPLGPEA